MKKRQSGRNLNVLTGPNFYYLKVKPPSAYEWCGTLKLANLRGASFDRAPHIPVLPSWMLFCRWLTMAARIVDRLMTWAHWARPRVKSSFQQARTRLVLQSCLGTQKGRWAWVQAGTSQTQHAPNKWIQQVCVEGL